MFFPTSGHIGFDLIQQSTEYPPLEIVQQMIIYETHLRLSKSIQQIMDEYRDDEAAVTYVHDLIQQHVVELFGYQDLNALRTALHRFPDDPIVKSAFYGIKKSDWYCPLKNKKKNALILIVLVKNNQITQGLVTRGQAMRDVQLYTIDGKAESLFTKFSNEQPLIIIAGSTSWPPFRANAERMKFVFIFVFWHGNENLNCDFHIYSALVRSHRPEKIRFLAVYIAEAHARDQWPVGETISCVDQPRTLEERLVNARNFRDSFHFEMEMLVDNMNNDFHHTYGAWPFRFFIVNHGILVFKAEPNKDNFAYDFNQIYQWIESTNV